MVGHQSPDYVILCILSLYNYMKKRILYSVFRICPFSDLVFYFLTSASAKSIMRCPLRIYEKPPGCEVFE